MKKIFITGITGLVGTHLANTLADTEYHVLAISRDPSKYNGKRSPNITIISMDLERDFNHYLQNVDIVIHLAGETATNLPRSADYDRLNFEDTVQLFESAKAQQVKHFIFISTGNTIGFGDLADPGTEERAMSKSFASLAYAQSKLKAEDYLKSHSDNIKLTILNPTFILGMHTGKPSSSRIFLMALNKRIVFYPPGGKNFVGTHDVVQAILLTFQQDAPQAQYLIAGENASYREFFERLRHLSNQKQVLIPLPKPVLIVLGLLGNGLRFFGFKTSLSSANMAILGQQTFYSARKSVVELGMRYTSLEEIIKDTLQYWKSTNTQ